MDGPDLNLECVFGFPGQEGRGVLDHRLHLVQSPGLGE